MKRILEQPLVFLTNKNKLEGRFDPRYYQPIFISTLINLTKRLKIKDLREISKIFSGATPLAKGPAYTDRNKGVAFVRSGNLSDENIIDYDNILYIQKEVHKKALKRSKLKKFDILVAIVGATIGKTAIFLDNCEANVNQAIAVVRLKDPNINPLYVLYFLRTKYGQLQLERIKRPVARANINTEEIGLIKIPIPSIEIQNKIAKIMQQAYENKKENLKKADELLDGIDNFILNELGIKLPKIEEKDVFTVKKSELEQRFDAGFYKEKYLAMVRSLTEGEKREKYKLIKFQKISDYFKKGIEVGSKAYINEGILFIRVENIQDYRLVITENSKFISKECYRQLSNFKPKIGEILLTKDGTIGRAFLVENEVEGITSGGILRIGFKKDVNSYYICGLLNSKFMRVILERYAIGAVIKHLLLEIIKETLLPIPSLQIQDRIAKIIRQRKEKAEKLTQEANGIVDKAKLEVEKMIEGR